MPTMNPEAELSLTISGCTIFQTLTSKLHQMKIVIAPAIFKHCWRFVADQLCKVGFVFTFFLLYYRFYNVSDNIFIFFVSVFSC